MPKRSGNTLLDSLPAASLARLLPKLSPVTLKRAQSLAEPGQEIDDVYFPSRSVISTLTLMSDGGSVEVMLAGHEGMSGIAVLFGGRISPHSIIVQIPGPGYRMNTDQFLGEMREDRALYERVLAYGGYSLTAATQFAACNRLHPIEERYARWILMADDRFGGTPFSLTQEFSAQMLGVRRPSVTMVAGAMSNSGLITYRRGLISVLNREGLQEVACECYGAVNGELERMMGYGPENRLIADGLPQFETSSIGG